MISLEATKRPITIQEEILLAQKFTETYQAYDEKDIYSRELACMRVQYPACLCEPQPGDLFVGRTFEPFICFSPQPRCRAVGYSINEETLETIQKDTTLSQNDRVLLDRLASYWLREQTKEKIKAAYPVNVKRWTPYDDYFVQQGVAFPLYRISGTQLDYKKLLTLGIDGLHALIYEKEQYADQESLYFYQGLHQTLYLFDEFCNYYRNHVIDVLKSEKLEPKWRKELIEMKDSLMRVQHQPVSCFRDAIQLTYLWWVFAGSNNFGRIDTFLAKYYVYDVECGVISEERALELLCGLWQILGVENLVYDSRVIIGGKGREEEEICNRFCKLAIAATRKVHGVVPQLTLRFYEGMDQELLEDAYQAIGEGCTFPMLYNDDVNVSAVSKAFGLSEEIAQQYCPYGCGEYTIEHASIGTPSGIINLTKALEITLNHGKDMETGEVLGLDLGGLETYQTFDDLFAAYKQQVEHFVALMAKVEEIEYVCCSQHMGFLAFSMLYDDCISRGKSLLNGGVRYLGGTLESYGNINCADSLTAIKQLVYDEQRIEAKQFLQALKTNCAEAEELRQLALQCPKYGNENDMADEMLISIHEHVCQTTREHVKDTILHSYLIVVINNNTNTVLGHLTAASADGRLPGVYLANANNPQGGADTKGLTAMLNSIVKPPIHYHAGSVQNLKLNAEMFKSEMLMKTKALLQAYFNNGGAQIMITVVSPQELEDAIIHPKLHKDLIVRVGGFSAKFIELGVDVQQEILSRSLHG